MGQKVSPIAFRVGVSRESDAVWCVPHKKKFAKTLAFDLKIRDEITKMWAHALISKIVISRQADVVTIKVFVSRPGIVLGKKGEEVERMKTKLSAFMNVPVHITIEEIKRPDTDAKLVSENIAQQLVKRAMFRRVMKKAMSSAMRQGAKGIKVCIGGRLGGAEIARTEWLREGRVPLHTLRADIDYGFSEAKTTAGIIGVKVWIYKGEVSTRRGVTLDTAEQKQN